MDIDTRIITYREILDGGPAIDNDDFGLAAKYTERRRETVLAKPNLKDYDSCACQLKLSEGKVGGRSMQFYTALKADGRVYSAISGSTLDVVEPYRKWAVGAELMMYPVFTMTGDFVIAAGISEIALPLYKKLKYSVFEFPRLMVIRNVRPLLEYKGIKGTFNKIVSAVFNPLLKGASGVVRRIMSCRLRRLNLECAEKVPDWVADLALNDGHRFMEYHNRDWLQWNLDYNFKGDKEDVQALYIVKDGERNLGFFMIKERKRESAGALRNIILGSIVEWGTADESLLSEKDLILLAIPRFSKAVDLIEFASDDPKTIRVLKKAGFIPFGFAHVAFKDKKKKYPEAKDPRNWRLRLGYADVILT